MKKITGIILIALSVSQLIFTQQLDKTQHPGLASSSKQNENSEFIQSYNITCYFESVDNDEQRTNISNPGNWTVKNADGKVYNVNKVSKTPDSKIFKIKGDFQPDKQLYVIYTGDGVQQAEVIPDSNIVNNSVFKMGEGSGIKLAFRRLAEDRLLYAVDYDAKVDIAGNYFYPSNNLFINSYSLNLVSNGTFANAEAVNNGTQSSLEISVIPYCFAGGIIYRGEFHFGYQLETKMDSTYFAVCNKSFKAGAVIEVPYTNYPMYLLHSYTGYVRLAMPLIIGFNYYPKGEDADGNSTLARYDLSLMYELAFSKYLIVRGEWAHSQFFDAPAGTDTKKEYSAITFAQDLIVLKSYLGFLKLLLGDDEIGDKNFIFYKIESGSKAPAFVPVNQQSIGVGLYF